MGQINIPSSVPTHYYDKYTQDWVTADTWNQMFYDDLSNAKDSKEVAEGFYSMPKKNLAIFFSTQFPKNQPNGWEHLMVMVLEKKSNSEYNYYEVKTLHRYGYMVGSPETNDEMLQEINQYFEDGQKHMNDITDQGIYWKYIGNVDDYPNLVGGLIKELEGV